MVRHFVHNKLWSDLEPTKPMVVWVARNVLALPDELIVKHRRNLPSLIYRVFHGLKPSENSYVTKYNAARADIIAELVNPVDGYERAITIASDPEGDISYWLCSHVLLFSDLEISVLCNISTSFLESPGRDLLSLVKECYKILRKIHLQDPLIQHWHRQRHIMIRYFLDAVYHEI